MPPQKLLGAEAHALIEELASSGVCRRCVLRFFNVTLLHEYLRTDADLARLFAGVARAHRGDAADDYPFNKTPPPPSPSPAAATVVTDAAAAAAAAAADAPAQQQQQQQQQEQQTLAACSVCKGALQHYAAHERTFVAALRVADYQFETLFICISVPTSTLVRQAAVYTHCQRRLDARLLAAAAAAAAATAATAAAAAAAAIDTADTADAADAADAADTADVTDAATTTAATTAATTVAAEQLQRRHLLTPPLSARLHVVRDLKELLRQLALLRLAALLPHIPRSKMTIPDSPFQITMTFVNGDGDDERAERAMMMELARAKLGRDAKLGGKYGKDVLSYSAAAPLLLTPLTTHALLTKHGLLPATAVVTSINTNTTTIDDAATAAAEAVTAAADATVTDTIAAAAVTTTATTAAAVTAAAAITAAAGVTTRGEGGIAAAAPRLAQSVTLTALFTYAPIMLMGRYCK
jgi:hypothetical protein